MNKIGIESFQSFTKEHIEEYLEYIYESYRATDPYYANGDEAEEFQNYARAIITHFIEAAEDDYHVQLCRNRVIKFLRIDGKMAIADFSCQLHYFYNKLLATRKICAQQFKAIQKSKIFQTDLNKGVMRVKIVVRKEFMNKGLLKAYDAQKARMLILDGFEYGLYLISNPIMRSYIQKRGGQFTDYKIKEQQKQSYFDIAYAKIKLSNLCQSKEHTIAL